MLYIVIASYQLPSEPMSYDEALKKVRAIQEGGGYAHIAHFNH